MTEKPSIKEFLRALGGNWLNRMSGPASVPSAILAVFIPNRWGSISLLLLSLLCLIWTAYSIWRVERLRVIQLEKVDRRDLQRMLGGMFLNEREFLYRGEINLCADYRGKFAIESLRDNFALIQTRAPHDATAIIKLQFMNSRQLCREITFYVQDGEGQTRCIDDIYQLLYVRLDKNGAFRLKVVYSAAYEIDEHASLLVDLQGFII